MTYDRDEAMRQQEATEAMIRMREPRGSGPHPDPMGDALRAETYKRQYLQACQDHVVAIARVRELEAALKPFAKCAEHDIGETEHDSDTFRNSDYNRAPKITVGDLRRARAAMAEAWP